MKKIIILVVSLFIAIAIMAYYYFSRLNTENDAKDLALQSATNNAALVFSFKNDKSFFEIIGSQHILQKALGTEKSTFLLGLKKRFIDIPEFNNFIQDQPVYVSLLSDTNKTLNFLLTVQIKPTLKIGKLESYLQKGGQLINNKNDIIELKLNDSTNVFIGIQKEVLTLSTSLSLINNAAIRLSENPFTAYIKENSQISKNALLTLFVNFNKAPQLLHNILAGQINGELSVFNQQNSYASLNYNFSKERIIFNGSTQTGGNSNYLSLFEDNKPHTTAIQNILPENTANFTLYAFDEYPSFLRNLKNLQTQTNESKKVQNVIEKVKNVYRIDLSSVFTNYTKKEFIVFQLNTSEKLAAIALNNGEKVKQLLLDVSTDYNDEIKLFKTSDILMSYFGEPFKKFSRPYYSIIDNYLILANNASTVQVFLNDYKSNKLLIQSPIYQDAVNQVPGSSNISYYINTKNSSDLFRNHIILPYYRHLRADSGLKEFDTFFYQMSADRNKFITNILLNKYLPTEIPDSLSKR